jgi:hypothetical protein
LTRTGHVVAGSLEDTGGCVVGWPQFFWCCVGGCPQRADEGFRRLRARL